MFYFIYFYSFTSKKKQTRTCNFICFCVIIMKQILFWSQLNISIVHTFYQCKKMKTSKLKTKPKRNKNIQILGSLGNFPWLLKMMETFDLYYMWASVRACVRASTCIPSLMILYGHQTNTANQNEKNKALGERGIETGGKERVKTANQFHWYGRNDAKFKLFVSYSVSECAFVQHCSLAFSSCVYLCLSGLFYFSCFSVVVVCVRACVCFCFFFSFWF